MGEINRPIASPMFSGQPCVPVMIGNKSPPPSVRGRVSTGPAAPTSSTHKGDTQHRYPLAGFGIPNYFKQKTHISSLWPRLFPIPSPVPHFESIRPVCPISIFCFPATTNPPPKLWESYLALGLGKDMAPDLFIKTCTLQTTMIIFVPKRDGGFNLVRDVYLDHSFVFLIEPREGVRQSDSPIVRVP